MLRGSHGSDLCRRIKDNPATQKIPVVLMSAAHEIPKIATSCDADGFVEKPFDLADIELVFEKYLK